MLVSSTLCEGSLYIECLLIWPHSYHMQICLEMLYFANYSGDADSSIIRETWSRLMEQALSQGGIAEACSVLKRVGSHVYPGDGVVLPLDVLCLHLEKAALVSFSLLVMSLILSIRLRN